MFDTIAAISSGIINQPISIIRMSGPDAFKIIKKIFRGNSGKNREITYGQILNGKELVDEVLVMWFKGPNSFTGEDIVEINAHGGVINSNKILELLLTNGARLAQRGEFSRRAFLSGKLDLIKAEAIHDLIFAKTEAQSKLAVSKFNAQTSNYIQKIINELLTIIATIETNIDYPEYDDIEILTNQILLPRLINLAKNLNTSVKLSHDARYIAKGVKVAIVGKPNVGKSTLLNTLLGKEKAIVTNIPGTTRDVVEGEMVYQEILFKLFDTAGIHHTTDIVENKGIYKSLDQIEKADLVIHLLDPTVKLDQDDHKIIKQAEGKIYLQVFSKHDLHPSKGLSISAKKGQISTLLEAIKTKIPHINLDNYQLVTNARQLSLIEQAKNNINSAIEALKNGFNPDEVIVDIKIAWENLTNITGRADNEKLLDEMFKNFCLGK